MKKVVDEREELEILRIEHIGFYSMFYGVAALILLRTMFPEFSFISNYGMDAILLIGATIVLVGCCKKGVWSCNIRPTNKSNLIISILSSIGYSIILFVILFKNTETTMTSLMITCGAFCVGIFLLTIILLTVLKKIVIDRKKKLEDDFEDDK